MKYKVAVKRLRIKLCLTQSEFASLFKVSNVTVNRWEKGVYQPTMKIKRELMAYFNKYGIQVDGTK